MDCGAVGVLHAAGSDGVHADGRPLRRHCARKGNDPGLRRAVGAVARARPLPGYGREVDDGAASALQHRAGGGAGAQKHARQIQTQALVKIGGREVDQRRHLERLSPSRARVVDPNVEPSERGERLLDDALRLIGLADVGENADGLAAHRLYLAHDGLDRAVDAPRAARHGLRRAGDDGHVRAMLRERERDAAPDALARAGHHRGPSGEVKRRHALPALLPLFSAAGARLHHRRGRLRSLSPFPHSPHRHSYSSPCRHSRESGNPPPL